MLHRKSRCSDRSSQGAGNTRLRATLAAVLLAASVALGEGPNAPASDRVLYNGIELPAVWPPVREITYEPMAVPYLASPPAVIPIDVGRQLFVDDFLIEQTTLKRAFHLAEWYKGNPVLKPDKPWEQTINSQGQPAPCAMVFSDGVWYDPAEKIFKMWYMGGYCTATCYATSKDGIIWEKPSLDVVSGTNIVHRVQSGPGEEWQRDSGTVWWDPKEKNPKRRYKMFLYAKGGNLEVFFSPDGVHWSELALKNKAPGDRLSVFYNPFRKMWVYNLRDYAQPPGIGRYRRYKEHADVLEGAKGDLGKAAFWVGADRLDPPREDVNTPPELYNTDAVAYESILLGCFSIWRGQPKDRAKPNDLCLGFSRDGFHWDRPDRRPFLAPSEKYGDWNWANIQSAGGCCLVVGDKLYFYVSGRAGVRGSPASGVCSTGLATLRRDGFASMEAGESEGTLTTRTVRFGGQHLFVNADAAGGPLQAEVLDVQGQVIAPFSRANCQPVNGDKTLLAVTWNGAPDLSAVAGRPVRFRFHLKKGRLFAFWVSPDRSGASHGYVAAGGPGFTGLMDTVGATNK